MQKNNNIKNIRRAIRALQEIPLVMSVIVIINFASDTLRLSVGEYLCPLFGISAYIMLRLYMISRLLYVSRWAKMLYVILAFVCLMVFVDNIFAFKLLIVDFQQLVFSMFIIGCISSFITYIYDKYKHGF